MFNNVFLSYVIWQAINCYERMEVYYQKVSPMFNEPLYK